jgi:hypothetical protein
MALIDEVKAVCDRLAPLGWRGLLKSTSGDALDIEQKTPEALQKVLMAQLSRVDRTVPGFEDFDSAGDKGITAGKPSQSLLYHALASPGVVRDAKSALLKGFPTLAEIETVENFVFGIQPPTLDSLVKKFAGAKLSVVVYATEYRPCADTADGAHADLTFSRTGIARIGTSRPKWYADVRGYWPEDEDNPHGFRVIPVRFTAWLAAPTKGQFARVMRVKAADAAADNDKTFWVPVHKLFDGPECLAGQNLTLTCSAKFFNLKLQRVLESVKQKAPNAYPYVIEDGLAELKEQSEFGRIAVVPVVQVALVRPAIINGKPHTYRVPRQSKNDDVFATWQTPSHSSSKGEIHPYPAYVHARTKVLKDKTLIDLNDEEDVIAAVSKGGYDALLHIDMTGEGWVDVKVPQLAGRSGIKSTSRAAYVLLSAPDFFPSCGQRELSRWSKSPAIPASFSGQLWGAEPTALSETRCPANLQLPGSPFDPKEDTMTAVIGMGSRMGTPVPAKQPDAARASTLPDDGAGEFAPGWDVAVDVKGPVKGGTVHLAGYGLGSPFPEDAKLCAALSTFWPAVAPDVYRTMSMHTGNPELRGTVAPLTDEEIGQIGSLPWDGVTGPKVVQMDGKPFVEMASFLNVDYVTNAIENRFSNRLTSRITADEYERRVLAAARVHWVLSGGTNVAQERTRWLFLSFRAVTSGDRELQAAQDQASHVLDGTIYRVETCFIGNPKDDPSLPSPKGPRFRLLPLVQRNFLFVSAEDSTALRRREENPQWGRAAAE